jgi:hypothetical protein
MAPQILRYHTTQKAVSSEPYFSAPSFYRNFIGCMRLVANFWLCGQESRPAQNETAVRKVSTFCQLFPNQRIGKPLKNKHL